MMQRVVGIMQVTRDVNRGVGKGTEVLSQLRGSLKRPRMAVDELGAKRCWEMW